MSRRCPKCGRPVTESDVICPGCDFVLDTSFLGDDITDDLASARVSLEEPAPATPPPVGPEDRAFGEDAVILGSGVADEWESFDAEDTGFVQREVTNARIYVGGSTQALLAADAIPGLKGDADPAQMRLSPYEQHVLQFINGRRPVGRIRRKSGMEDVDVKLALAMMADKGLIQLVGVVDEARKNKAREKRRARLRAERAKKRRARKEQGRSSSSGGRPGAAASARPAPASARPSAATRPSAPPADEATRVEAIPASLRDALQAGSEADASTGGRRKKKRLAPEPTEAPPEESTRRRRRRPPLPGGLKKSDEDGGLSEVSGLAQVSEPPARGTERRPLLSGIDSTAVIQAPLADDDRDVDQVFSSASDAATEAIEAYAPLAPDGDEEIPEALPSAPPGVRAAMDLDEVATFEHQASALAPSVSTEAIEGMAGGGLPSELDDDDDHDDDDDDHHDDDDDDGADAFEADPTAAIDLAALPGGLPSLELPSIEVVSEMPAPPVEDLSEGGAPPPLPRDSSLLEQVAEAPAAADEEVEVYDLPTGPVTAALGSVRTNDSLLPTGEHQAVSLELSISSPDVAVDGAGSPDEDAAGFDDPDIFASSVADASSLSEGPLSLPSEALIPLPSRPSGPAVPPAPLVVADSPGLDLEPPEEEDDDGGPDAEDDDYLAEEDESDEGAPASSVSFENRRKAEKIFEQATKDLNAGNVGSALMNAKLAMIYDPSNKVYKRSCDEWAKLASGSPKRTGKVREDVQLFEQAKLAETRRQYDRAVRLLEKALTVNPKAAPVYNLLGVIQATRLKQYKDASNNLLKACELAPSNLSFKNNLGKVLGMLEEHGEKKDHRRDDEEDVVKVRKIRPKFF